MGSLYCNLISAKREDGLRKYEEMARFLLYRIPIYRRSETGNKQSPSFTIDLIDLSEDVKEQLVSVSKTEAKLIVKEAVCLLFENLGPREREYFNNNVRHLLKVVFV